MAASILTHRHAFLTDIGIPKVLLPILYTTGVFLSVGIGFAIALAFAKI